MTEILVILCIALAVDFLFSPIVSNPVRIREALSVEDLCFEIVRQQIEEPPSGNATSENVRKAQEAVRKVRMSCLTANEVRKLNNLPPLNDGESRGIHA